MCIRDSPKASRNLVKKSAVNAGLIDDINSFPEGFKTIQKS